MNPRPLSVTIISWLFIAAGTVGVVYHANEFKPQRPFENDAVWILFVRLMAIVCGVLMLRGSTWGRWLLLLRLSRHPQRLSLAGPVGHAQFAVGRGRIFSSSFGGIGVFPERGLTIKSRRKGYRMIVFRSRLQLQNGAVLEVGKRVSIIEVESKETLRAWRNIRPSTPNSKSRFVPLSVSMASSDQL